MILKKCQLGIITSFSFPSTTLKNGFTIFFGDFLIGFECNFVGDLNVSRIESIQIA